MFRLLLIEPMDVGSWMQSHEVTCFHLLSNMPRAQLPSPRLHTVLKNGQMPQAVFMYRYNFITRVGAQSHAQKWANFT